MKSWRFVSRIVARLQCDEAGGLGGFSLQGRVFLFGREFSPFSKTHPCFEKGQARFLLETFGC